MKDIKTDLRFEKGKLTKERILNSAFEIICNEGVEGLSGSKLAKLSGISKSNVFHHFKYIDEIPLTVYKNIGDSITSEVVKQSFADFRSYLLFLGDMAFCKESKDLKFYKAFFSFYQQAMHDPKYKDAVDNCSNDFKNVLIDLIGKYYKISNEKKDYIATLIYTTIDGMGMHFLISPERESYKKVWRDFTDIVIKMLEE